MSPTSITGPPYCWPIALQSAGSVIGTGCEYSSPLRTAASSDARHGPRSSASDGSAAISRVNGVASTEKRTGSIGFGVNS